MKAINKLVCVEQSILFYPYTRAKLINKLRPKSSCQSSSPSPLDLKHDPKSDDFIASYWCEL